jgi:malonyl-CoA/methylmalonyl-CoA synthetase
MTLTADWAAHWRAAPERVVLVDAASGAALDGAGVEQCTAVVAWRLRVLGVRPGDRVLLSCAPSIATVLVYAGILRLGAAVVPANTAYTEGELAHIVGDARPVLAVLDDAARSLDVPLGCHSPEVLRRDTPVAVAAMAADPVALDAADDSDVAMIAYTSGTTGRPKGAVLEHGNLRRGAESLVEAWEWSPHDRLVHALPMFHMHGLGAGINGSLTAGASVVVLPRFDADAVVEAARVHGATLFFGVPTMYARLRDAGRLPDLAALRVLVSGSAPLDPVLFQAISAQTGQAPVERYGMTETVMLTSNPLRGERRAGSVGLPLPRVQVRLGAAGAVEVNGPTVFRGYWDRPDATREAFTQDGWFRTGDIGEIDDDGYLRLVGRASDLIITGGYNVYPREVEDAILDHPDVVDVAVVGVPDEAWGETVAAYVVLRGSLVARDADEAEVGAALTAHVSTRLAPYKHPRRWTVVADLPRNQMGKVLRAELRAQSGGGHEEG